MLCPSHVGLTTVDARPVAIWPGAHLLRQTSGQRGDMRGVSALDRVRHGRRGGCAGHFRCVCLFPSCCTKGESLALDLIPEVHEPCFGAGGGSIF
jgi:hypothetical protein